MPTTTRRSMRHQRTAHLAQIQNNFELLEHLLGEAERLSDSIIFECNQAGEWLEAAAVQRIAGDASEISEAVAFVRKRLPTSEEGSI